MNGDFFLLPPQATLFFAKTFGCQQALGPLKMQKGEKRRGIKLYQGSDAEI